MNSSTARIKRKDESTKITFSRNHNGDALVLADGDVVAVAKDCEGYGYIRAHVLAFESKTAELQSLIRRAMRQLEKWQDKYGEHNPAWLPPDGDIRLMEDAAELVASNVTGLAPEKGNQHDKGR